MALKQVRRVWRGREGGRELSTVGGDVNRTG